METTAVQITDAVKTAASEMAEKMEMQRVELNWRAMCEDELMMVATSEGINIGRLHVNYGEMRTYRFETYSLNGVELLEKRYGITETGWEHMPTVTRHLDEDAVIYTGW